MTATESTSSTPALPPADVRAPALDARQFILGSLGALVVCALLLALLAALINQNDWWRGYFAGAVAGLFAATASIVPTIFLFRQPLTVVMSGFLAIGGLRAIAVAVVVIVAVKMGGYPKYPTVAFSGFFYLTLVAIEGLLLWNMISAGVTGSPKADVLAARHATPTTQDNA